jgi:hypothetical protein
MPQNFKNGLIVLSISQILGLIGFIMFILDFKSPVPFLATYIAIFVFKFSMIVTLAFRRKWAFYGFIVGDGYGYLPAGKLILLMFKSSSLVGILVVTHIVMEICALVLLYLSRDYFYRR